MKSSEEKTMTRNLIHWASAAAFATTLFCGYGFAPAASARQASPSSPAQSSPAQQQQQPAPDKNKQQPLQMDTPQGSAPPSFASRFIRAKAPMSR